MSRGIVVTAKGQRLNFDELILKATRPMLPPVDAKDKVTPQRMPSPQMRVMGFMPSAEGMPQTPKLATPVLVHEIPAAPDGPSMADFTGIRVDETKHIKEKPQDPMAVATDTLQDIMVDLDKYAPESRKRAGKKS